MFEKNKILANNILFENILRVNKMKTKIIFSILISLSLLLFGCNGNNSENSSPSPPLPDTSELFEVYQLNIKVEPKLKDNGLKNLDEILTLFDGMNDVEGTLEVLGDKNIVWGIDESENILIGGLGVRGQNLILNAETTAIALVYNLLNIEAKSINNIEEMIRVTGEFKNLSNSIEENILKNKPIDNDNIENLNESLQSIITELAQHISTPQANVFSTKALPIDPSVNTDTNPHIWVDAITATIKIESKRKQILSNFPIEMTIRNDNSTIKIESNSAAEQFLISQIFRDKSYSIPGPTNRTFDLQVFQTDTNYYNNVWQNILDTFVPAVVTDLEVIPGSHKLFVQCAEAVRVIDESARDLDDTTDTPLSEEGKLLYIPQKVTEAVVGAILSSQDCIGKEIGAEPAFLERLKDKMAKFVGISTNQILDYAEKGLSILNSALSLQKTYFTVKYYIDRPTPITVCVDINNNIANCAARFETDPKSLVLIPGDELEINLKSFTKDEKLTILPNSIEISTEGVKFSSITLDKSKNAIKIHPNNIGRESFKIIDEITEEKSDATIENIQPIFDKQNLVLLPNDKGQAKLVDSQERTIRFKKQDLFEFSSSNTEVATVTGIGLTANITTKLPGTATITAKNLATGTTSNLNLEVQYQDLNYVATLTESGTGECEDGTYTVTGTFKSLDPKTPSYLIAVRRVSFTTILPTRITRTLTYPEDGGTTRDTFTANIDFKGFSGSGSYTFTHEEGYTCSGRYTFEGKFLKEED